MPHDELHDEYVRADDRLRDWKAALVLTWLLIVIPLVVSLWWWSYDGNPVPYAITISGALAGTIVCCRGMERAQRMRADCLALVYGDTRRGRRSARGDLPRSAGRR